MKNLSLATAPSNLLRERAARLIAGVSQVGRGPKPTYYCPNCKCNRYRFCTCALPVGQRKKMVYRNPTKA